MVDAQTTELDLVARLRDVGDCGFFHMELFPLAAKEIEQLRLDVAQQTTNATAVLQAQHERDCAVEKLAELRVMLVRVRNGTVPHALRYDIDMLLDGPADDVPADPERVEIARCRCGGFPRPTLMGRTICSACGQDVLQPAPTQPTRTKAL